jgi:thioredoxin 1
MSVVNIDDSSFVQEVEQSDKPVLVDFYADWCMPCKILGPVMEEIASEKSDVKICKLNVDVSQETAAKFGVMSIPTVVLFKDGQKVDQFVGALPKDQIEQFLSSHLS